MDQQELRRWEHNVDVADTTPITANLPDPAAIRAGDTWVDERCSDGVVRTWLRVVIVGGSTGARWAYWKRYVPEGNETMRQQLGTHPDSHVIADRIFNGDASHFVGMLGVPYAGKPVGTIEGTAAWVLISPKAEPPAMVHVREERRAGDGVRYEKSKEVFDVETGETKILP